MAGLTDELAAMLQPLEARLATLEQLTGNGSGASLLVDHPAGPCNKPDCSLCQPHRNAWAQTAAVHIFETLNGAAHWAGLEQPSADLADAYLAYTQTDGDTTVVPPGVVAILDATGQPAVKIRL